MTNLDQLLQGMSLSLISYINGNCSGLLATRGDSPSALRRPEQLLGKFQARRWWESLTFDNRHFQTFGAVTGRLGHAVLLDPGNRNLRATVASVSIAAQQWLRTTFGVPAC